MTAQTNREEIVYGLPRTVVVTPPVINGLLFASGSTDTTDPLVFKIVKSSEYDANNDLPTPVYLNNYNQSAVYIFQADDFNTNNDYTLGMKIA